MILNAGQFEKVSREQFIKDWEDTFPIPESQKDAEYFESINAVYDLIKLPDRATKGSAGYDFYSPLDFELKSGMEIKIPTGIRVRMGEGWMLGVYPRSSLGFKYQVQLANTVGIIDSDYYNGDNEGHIFIKLVNRGNGILNVKADDRFAQGIFTQFGITYNDNVESKRSGGMGSTGV